MKIVQPQSAMQSNCSVRAEEKLQNVWIALYVRSRAEKKVERLLSEKGVEVYLPLIHTLRQWSDRKQKVALPMLPGYLFVKTDARKTDLVLGTDGVVNVVRLEKKIAVIRDFEIERLRAVEKLGCAVEAGFGNSDIQNGDEVEIKEGPLKGLVGRVNKLDQADNRSFEILIESIGCNLKVIVPAWYVDAVRKRVVK